MIHPDTEPRSIGGAFGTGVFATAPIPRGTITWVRDPLDQTISRARSRELPTSLREMLAEHAYFDLDGNYVLCWDHARYMNHSCEPNCRGVGLDCEIAVRDIVPDEQLTGNYSTMGITHALRCRCGSLACRGIVRPEDGVLLGAGWDAEVVATAALVSAVAQPLWGLLREAARAALASAVLPASRTFHAERRPSAVPIADRALWRID